MDTTQQTLPLPTFKTTHASAAGTCSRVQELVTQFSADSELHLLPLSPEFHRVALATGLEAALKPLTPLSPVNDILLCPPLTTKQFKPRQFDTPEEEEAWWSDPRTYPGDHLVAANNTPFSLSEYDRTSRSYITSPSPEPSEREDHNNWATDLPQIHPMRMRPVRSCQRCVSSDESDGSEIEIFSDDNLEVPSKGGQGIHIHAMSNPGAQPSPRPRDGGSLSEEGRSDDEDVDPDSKSEDEYSPDTAGPAHCTRASHTRRAALRRKAAPLTKGTRTYKSRTTTPKNIRPKPKTKRREFLSIPEEHLPLLRNEESRLRASGEKPPPFELPGPVRSDSNGRYQCSHVRDGRNCKITSGRHLEGRRHVLTHFDLHYLCINPQCPSTFARDDSLKRHLDDTECRNQKNHPPGVTTGDYEGAVIKEGEVYRLVRIAWE